MRIALLSDLHLDHYTDGEASFCKRLDSIGVNADVAVLAGDIADGRFSHQFRSLFKCLRKHVEHVVMVTGNHEYYKAGRPLAHHSIRTAAAAVSNVHFLHGSSVEIGHWRFHGHTMWYRDHESNSQYEHWMNDVHNIPSFKEWVYEENANWQSYLDANLAYGDIVVTHHLPSGHSTPAQYKGSPLNRFFVCDMEELILSRKPAIWYHGHTHGACDYILGDTRVVANPRGYPRENSFGPDGYRPKEIEL